MWGLVSKLFARGFSRQPQIFPANFLHLDWNNVDGIGPRGPRNPKKGCIMLPDDETKIVRTEV